MHKNFTQKNDVVQSLIHFFCILIYFLKLSKLLGIDNFLGITKTPISGRLTPSLICMAFYIQIKKKNVHLFIKSRWLYHNPQQHYQNIFLNM